MSEDTPPKSGNELIAAFFESLSTNIDPSLDKAVVEKVVSLFKDGKLSNKNLLNELSLLREGKPSNVRE
jgi:hypothetical protein